MDITKYLPDTCKCTINYSNDNGVINFYSITKCQRHLSLPDEDAFKRAIAENRAKNFIVNASDGVATVDFETNTINYEGNISVLKIAAIALNVASVNDQDITDVINGLG